MIYWDYKFFFSLKKEINENIAKRKKKKIKIKIRNQNICFKKLDREN